MSCVWPSRIVTLPVGVPLPDCGATPMLSVSVWPVVSCVAEASSVVVLAANDDALTLMESAVEVDTAKFESPAYVAVMECEPSESDVVV